MKTNSHYSFKIIPLPGGKARLISETTKGYKTYVDIQNFDTWADAEIAREKLIKSYKGY